MSPRGRRSLRALAAGVILAVAAWAPPARASGLRSPELRGSDLHSPDHPLGPLRFGGSVELRFGDDRINGVSNTNWFSFSRINGFATAPLGSWIQVAAQGSWDRTMDDFTLERAEAVARLAPTLRAHAGIFLAPLGRSNLAHDAPRDEFSEPSLVATGLVGVPNAELGAGVRGEARRTKAWPFTYEVDLVTGYDDGLIYDAPGGTRLPSGRNNYGDKNGVPAVAARVAFHPSPRTELGLAGQSGIYNETTIGGVTIDRSRWVHLIVADGATERSRFRVEGEAAVARIDVPPGLEALFAESQRGAALSVARTLLDPLLRSWKDVSLTGALRGDAVDFDTRIRGDSRTRLSASLNVRYRAFAVTRFGWYYEHRRDRFNNDTSVAGMTVSAASYF
ncbi:MAG TPA: hypothetical protein VF363_12490 [Candidatus Eisenbacteria bacterium]